MKKLSRDEMKNVMGGNVPVGGRHTECWDCGTTLGVFCTSVSNSFTCIDAGGVSGIYLTCANSTTFETLNFTCAVS